MTFLMSLLQYIYILTCIFCSTKAYFFKDKETYYDLLHVPYNATLDACKKNYRKISLLFHPDRITAYVSSNITQNCNLTDFFVEDNDDDDDDDEQHYCQIEDIEVLKDYYLNVQTAYEILSDVKKKLQYDLSLQGQDFDYPDSLDDDENDDVYVSSSQFSSFMKSPYIKLSINILNPKSHLPNINLKLKIDISKTMESIKYDDYTYYRRKVCTLCQGKGGTECELCTFCNGNGISRHISNYNSNHDEQSSPSFQQMSTHTCRNCLGKGCIVKSKPCEACKSSGYAMAKEVIQFVVPKGVSLTTSVSLNNYGHQHKDGRTSQLILQVIYDLPPDWKCDYETGNLSYEMKVPLNDYVKGWNGDITTPFNEPLHINTGQVIAISSLTEGYLTEYWFKGALLSQNNNNLRGKVSIRISPDWSTTDEKTIMSILKELGSEGYSLGNSSYSQISEALADLTPNDFNFVQHM